jgi:hypothetical protein
MCFRQHLEVLVLEKSRLSFIMNFLKIHISSFSVGKDRFKMAFDRA